MGASESSTKRVTVEREEDNLIVRLCLFLPYFARCNTRISKRYETPLPSIAVAEALPPPSLERLKDGNIHMCFFSRSGLDLDLDNSRQEPEAITATVTDRL